MGYNTDFHGGFELDRPVDKKTADVLRALKEIRGTKNYGMPDSWCQWELNDDDQSISWDGGEKFYDYIPWIKFIVNYILAPQGYKLNGEVNWVGEDSEDMGCIRVVDNVVNIGRAVINYEFDKSEEEVVIDVDATHPTIRELYGEVADKHLLKDGSDD